MSAAVDKPSIHQHQSITLVVTMVVLLSSRVDIRADAIGLRFGGGVRPFLVGGVERWE